MTITVRQMTESDKEAWDTYVFKHHQGTFCHRAGWKQVISQGAKQKCPYLLAEDAGKIVGVLPLVQRKSLLFGNASISSMFAVYGGPLADTDEVYNKLDAAAWGLTETARAGSMEYRSIKARHNDNSQWVIEKDVAATFHKLLKSGEDEILLDIPRKQRAVVRKGLKAGLTCCWDKDVDTFYALYAESVRNLGTPVFPKPLFQEFVHEFADDVEIQVIRTPNGEAVASLMSFYHGDWVLPYYAGGSPAARKYAAHDYMYFQLMIRAAEQGKTMFDFGRSKIGTGPYNFKKNWGFAPIPLEYETRLAPGVEKPELNPTNKKFELMVKLWKKLPLSVATLLGPSISRHLG